MRQSFLFMVGLIAFTVATLNSSVRGQEAYSRGLGECPALVMTQVSSVVDKVPSWDVGSGTCVTSDGFILVSGHAVGETGSKIGVKFASGEKFVGSVVLKFDSQGMGGTGDDVGVIKVDSSKPLPHRSLVYHPPSPGQQLVSEGFPNGRYAKLSTAVLAVVPRLSPAQPSAPALVGVKTGSNIFATTTRMPHPELMVLSHRAQHGNSGGPIFDYEGDIVGITLAVPNRVDGKSNEKDFRTAAMSSRECSRFLLKAKAKRFLKLKKRQRPRMVIVVSAQPACMKYQQDYFNNAELRRYVDANWDAELMPAESIPAFCKAHGVTQTPAFIASNVAKHVEGYSSPSELMYGLGTELKATPVEGRKAVEFETLPDPEEQELKSLEASEAVKTEQTAVPAAEEEPKTKAAVKTRPRTDPVQPVQVAPEPDLSLAKVVWVIPTKAWVPDWLGGMVTKIEKGVGPVVGKISEASGGKLICGVVFQRQEGERFSSICTKAQVDPLKGGFVVLVPKRFQGIAGVVAGIVEKAIGQFPFLDSVPVKEFFQRDSPEAFAGVVEAVTADYETEEVSGNPVKAQHHVMGSLVVFLMHLGHKLRPRKEAV